MQEVSYHPTDFSTNCAANSQHPSQLIRCAASASERITPPCPVLDSSWYAIPFEKRKIAASALRLGYLFDGRRREAITELSGTTSNQHGGSFPRPKSRSISAGE